MDSCRLPTDRAGDYGEKRTAWQLGVHGACLQSPLHPTVLPHRASKRPRLDTGDYPLLFSCRPGSRSALQRGPGWIPGITKLEWEALKPAAQLQRGPGWIPWITPTTRQNYNAHITLQRGPGWIPGITSCGVSGCASPAQGFKEAPVGYRGLPEVAVTEKRVRGHGLQRGPGWIPGITTTTGRSTRRPTPLQRGPGWIPGITRAKSTRCTGWETLLQRGPGWIRGLTLFFDSAERVWMVC